MPLPFDATLKDLVRSYPQDWLTALGRPGEARLISPDLSSVSAFADLVFERDDRLFHLEPQTGADVDLPRRVLRYNVLLHERYNLPVESIVVLLRRSADRGDLTDRVQYEDRGGRTILDFRFEIIRVWQRPAADFLSGGLGMVPLAVLGELPAEMSLATALAGVVDQLTRRITEEAPREEAGHLLTAAYLLSGLRVRPEVANQLFEGVAAMHESSTYQYLLEQGEAKGRVEGEAKGRVEGEAKGRVEGEVDGERRVLLRQARVRFGELDPAVLTALSNIKDVDRLEALAERLLTAATWQEWLASS